MSQLLREPPPAGQSGVGVSSTAPSCDPPTAPQRLKGLWRGPTGLSPTASPGHNAGTSPDVPGSDEHRLAALLAGDAVHRELGDVVTAVGVDFWQLGGEGAAVSACVTSGQQPTEPQSALGWKGPLKAVWSHAHDE